MERAAAELEKVIMEGHWCWKVGQLSVLMRLSIWGRSWGQRVTWGRKELPRQPEHLEPLKEPVFRNSHLSYKTKRPVYRAVVLDMLRYGLETWITKHDVTKKLEAFHNRCLGGIVGITSAQQNVEHVGSVQVAKQFGMRNSWRI